MDQAERVGAQLGGAVRRSPGALQAAYYGISGVWPLVAYRSFERVTGPKREPWLVKTVGLLTAVIAAALAADPEGRSPATRRLGLGSAMAYGAVDVYYAGLRRRIRPVYLLDAVGQAVLVALWLARRASDRPSPTGTTSLRSVRGRPRGR